MKYTYRLPIFEAPGDAFAKMSDDQFADYQKKNPGTGERRNLGTFNSKKAAKEHEKDIQFFKHKG